MIALFKDKQINKIIAGKSLRETAAVVSEHILQLNINGEHFLHFSCTPQDLEMLVLGFLYNEGLIESKKDVKELSINADLSSAVVQLADQLPDAPPFQRSTSGLTLEKLPDTAGSKTAFFRMEPRQYFALVDAVLARQTLRTRVGGSHAAAFCTPNYVITVFEDIGRHNTLDKVAGYYLTYPEKIEDDNILLISGRISSEMVLKANRIGVKQLVSLNTPTSLAVEIAEQSGLTLITVLPPQEIRVFTNFEQINQNTEIVQ